MDNYSIQTRAKINLTLDIISKRPDGYHNVAMIMQSISLCDTLHFRLISKGIKLHCDNEKLPTDRENIVYKAAELLTNRFQVKDGIEISIEKRIPFAAGLAGGSTNAAGALIALNKLWNLDLKKDQLMELGGQLGADVPFCMLGGTALAEGIGDQLTKLNDLPPFYITMVKPQMQISTPWAYHLIDVKEIEDHPDNLGMIEAINCGSKEIIPLKLGNVFEGPIFKKYPELAHIKEKFKELKAMGQSMSGSGPTIFALYDNEYQAQKARDVLSKDYEDVFVARSFN